MASKNSDNYLLDSGVVMGGCKSRSGEEWLKLLQEKSREQGRALTWHQIKMNPELNHNEIMERVGRYASFEKKLMVDEPKTIPMAEEQLREITTGIKKPKSTPKDERLTSFSLPSIGDIVHPGNTIIIDYLNGNYDEESIENYSDGEEPIENAGVIILSKPEWFSHDMIKELLFGISDTVQITSVIVFQYHLELQIEIYASTTAMIPIDHGQLSLKLSPHGKRIYLIGAYFFLSKSCTTEDYLVLSYDPRQVGATILKEKRHYIPPDEPKSALY